MRGGGRLVLAVQNAYASLAVQASEAAPVKVFPLWPGVERLAPAQGRVLSGSAAREGHALFASGEGPVAMRIAQGKGDVILLSLPEIFQNGHLAAGDHLALLDRLAGTGRAVHFDEFVHGMEGQAGTMEILGEWGFGPLLILLTLAALAHFWRRRVRVGPEEDDHRESRVEAVDFVDSLALLYNRALKRRQAAALYGRAFEQAVAVQTGLRDAALAARVKEYLPIGPARSVSGKDLSAQDFARELSAINDAFRRLNDAQRPGSRKKAGRSPDRP